MEIGIVSDSHSDIENLKKALEFFKKRTKIILHAGDWDRPNVLELLKEYNFTVHAVLGNCDRDINGYFKEINKHNLRERIKLKEEINQFKLDNKKIAIYHGFNENLLDSLTKNDKNDLVITGHTHIPEVKKTSEKTLLVNPGSIVNYHGRVSKKFKPITAAIYDTNKMNAKIFEITN